MKVLICVSASVAIYKVCDLTRSLIKKGNIVRVVLSENANRMISLTLFEALGAEVFLHDTGKMEHISLTRWCDVLLLCPAGASTIGKIANGIGGSLLLDIFLAKSQNLRTVITPAMNVEMWNNVFVQANIQKLKNNGFEIIDPSCGVLACGEEGMGRLASIEKIEEVLYKKQNCLQKVLPQQKMSILITAGGTIEKMDDVRYLTNFSSGRQALEIVNAFKGHNVTVVLARVDVEFPSWCKIIKVESANEMFYNVMQELENCDVFIACAAVADFTFQKQDGKIKKQNITELKLVANPDILSEVCRDAKRPKCVVGFAAESENLLQNAKDKLLKKNCDLIVANKLVFGMEDSSGVIVFSNMLFEEFSCSKKELATIIKNKIEKLMCASVPKNTL